MSVRRLLLLAPVVLVVFLTIEIPRSNFHSTSVCGTCGEMLRETEWNVPFTNTTYWTTRSISDSALSLVVKKYGLDPSQTHTWLFAQGSGNGVICALGTGSQVLGVTSPPYIANYIANFIDVSCRCGEKQFAQHWLKLLLDPTTSNDARLAIGVAEMPAGGFANRDQFEMWWRSQSKSVAEFLNVPVPDLDGGKNP